MSCIVSDKLCSGVGQYYVRQRSVLSCAIASTRVACSVCEWCPCTYGSWVALAMRMKAWDAATWRDFPRFS